MRSDEIRFGVIGAGNMGEAILRGYLTNNYASGAQTAVFDPDAEKCRALERDLGVSVAQSLADLIEQSDLLLIAVKPNVCTHLFEEQFDRFRSGE